MPTLSEKIDQHLVDLLWSLWTELGVVGIMRLHQQCLIAPEELIILTSVIAEIDPRLRDEALDWCSRYHYFISISRLKALVKACGPSIYESFSMFAVTLNSVSKANWPIFRDVAPLKFQPSGKSKHPRCELPSLLYLRVRALFGVGARADLLTFFLTQNESDFTASDAAEVGYSKRSLADLLEDFVQSGIFDVSTIRNQRSYYFAKRDPMVKILGPVPKVVPGWNRILEVILQLRACVRQIENKSEGTKITEIRKILIKIEDSLGRLELQAPRFESDFPLYWDNFSNWILNTMHAFAKGNFKENQDTTRMIAWDEKQEATRRILIQFKGLFSNMESLVTHSNEQTANFIFKRYKGSFRKNLFGYLPKIHIDDQREIKQIAETLLSLDRSQFTVALKEEITLRIQEILKKYE